MKKSLLLIVAFAISFNSFAQKNEIKAAENALNANKFTEAISALKGAESLLGSAKDKQKAQYYLVLGKAYYGNGTTPNSFDDAISSLKKVVEIEKNSSKTYTDEANEILVNIIKDITKKATDAYSEGAKLMNDPATLNDATEKFTLSAAGFEKVYNISPIDTAFLQNAAYVYYFAHNYEKSIENYKKLLDIGYKGIVNKYTAVNKSDNSKEEFADQKEMDLMMKTGQYKNPEVIKGEPQTIEMKKMIVKNYLALNQNENALNAILEAKKSAPNDYGLLVDEANVYYAMGDNAKFKEKLEEAVKINPNDYILHYNIGVMKSDLKDYDGAIESYKNAIAINPEYADAYNNIGAAILSKAEPIVEEMNKNLNNFKVYDELQAKQLGYYREALPYFEKAFGYNSTNIGVVQALMGIYEQLEMYEKSKEMREVYNQLKQ